MILNTKVKSTDVTLLKDTKVIKRKGYISINYGNNFIDDNDEITFISELELEDGLLALEIKIGFTYKRSCVRCFIVNIAYCYFEYIINR